MVKRGLWVTAGMNIGPVTKEIDFIAFLFRLKSTHTTTKLKSKHLASGITSNHNHYYHTNRSSPPSELNSLAGLIVVS